MIGFSSNFRWLLLIVAVSGALLFTGSSDAGPVVFVFVLSAWVASICVHEFGHAIVAWFGGDGSIPGSGYLTFDPARYMDPVASLLFPALLVATGGFGFPGGAVYVNRAALRSSGWHSAVSAAGPLANLLLWAAMVLPLSLGIDERVGAPQFWNALAFLSELQMVGILINMLPVPGFDGYGVVEPLLPPELRRVLAPVAGWAAIAFVALVLLVPPIGGAFFHAATRIGAAVSVDPDLAWDGWDAFRFWRKIR